MVDKKDARDLEIAKTRLREFVGDPSKIAGGRELESRLAALWIRLKRNRREARKQAGNNGC